MRALVEFLEYLHAGDPIRSHPDVTVVPILSKRERSFSYLDIEEALNRGLAEITEISEQGSVPNLRVINKSETDIIILDGEELVGAKQNRIVNTTIVVPAFSEIVIPVSCVEQHRWAYDSHRFSTSDNVAYCTLRRSKLESVTENLKSGHGFRADQSRIWSDIADKSARMGIETETMAMKDIFVQRLEREAELPHDLPHQENQIGFLAFIRGGFAGGDFFGTPELCRRKFHKMLRSYYLDALDESTEFPALDASEILDQIRTARHEQFGSVGKGLDIRFESRNIQGAWKLVDIFIPHLVVFPKAKA